MADKYLTSGMQAPTKWKDLGDGSFAQFVYDETNKALLPLGSVQQMVSTTAVALSSIPAGATRAIIRPRNEVNWTDKSGEAPTASTGMYLQAHEVLVYDGGPLADVRLIRSSLATGDADVRVLYYG